MHSRSRFPARSALSIAAFVAVAAAIGCNTSSAKPALADTTRSAAGATANGEVATPPAAGAAAAPDAGGAATTTTASAAGTTAGTPAKLGAPPVVRALYVNRWASQGTKKMRHLIDIADSTEVNALVIDMKDEFGLNYKSADPSVQKNAGNSGAVPNLTALLDTLKAHKILPIARIVVFKDSVAARVNPNETIRKADGSAWRDKQGLAWVNPYSPVIREYNLKVAEELVKLGFGEVQFDYIRFPEPYKSLPPQVFPQAGSVSKPQALADFLAQARTRLNNLGVRSTADIFGLVTTVRGPLEIGQEWEKVSPVTDVLLPMTYPSHYPRGSYGIAAPNAEPRKIMYIAISRAHERDDKLGIGGEHVRPWIQAFTLGQPKYGPEHITAQKQGIYDAGYDGWVLWSPGSNYDIFLPALEKTLVSRKKPWKGTATSVAAAAAPAPSDTTGAARAETAKSPAKP